MYIFTGVDRRETPSYKGHSNKLYIILLLPRTYAQFHNIYPIPDHKFVLIMGKEDDEKIQADDEEKLLEKASKKPEPTSVKKTDRGSTLTKEEVKSIVATKFDKMEKKQAEFAASVEKKQDEFQILLNRMSSNIAKLVPSDKVDVQSSGGSRDLIQASFQDEPDHKEQSEDDCTDEENFEEPSFVNGLQSFKIARRIKPTELVV